MPLSPEIIEKLRQSGIRIDREGQLWHEGEVVAHEGLRQAIWRWLDRLPDGRHILRLDAERYTHVQVEDTPLVVRGLRAAADGGFVMNLSDGSEEPLDPAALTCDAAGTLRAKVREGRLLARLSTAATATLADHMETSAAGPTLSVGGRRHPIAAA